MDAHYFKTRVKWQRKWMGSRLERKHCAKGSSRSCTGLVLIKVTPANAGVFLFSNRISTVNAETGPILRAHFRRWPPRGGICPRRPEGAGGNQDPQRRSA